MILCEVAGPSRSAWCKMRKVRSSRKKRANPFAARMNICCGNRCWTHVKIMASSPHDRTSVLKMRFRDTAIVPEIRISEKKVVVGSLKDPTCPLDVVVGPDGSLRAFYTSYE